MPGKQNNRLALAAISKSEQLIIWRCNFMVFSLRKKTAQQQLVNTAEAFALWDMLVSRYQQADTINIYMFFVHDLDLKAVLAVYLNSIKKDINELEEKMNLYSINVPRAGRKSYHTSAQTEIIDDEIIAKWLLIIMQEDIEMFLKAIRVSATNDSVRRFFISKTKGAIDMIDPILKYLKLKGWTSNPPRYPNVPKNVAEEIDCAEAHNLWDLLTFRYDNIEQTQLFVTLAHDGDVKLMFKQGLQNTLKSQASILEKELDYFGIPLPKQPKTQMITVENTEFVDDDHMCRMVLSGMQGAAILHAESLKQCTTNDRVRNIFKKLLIDEIEVTDNLLKFLKLKGYVNQGPSYQL